MKGYTKKRGKNQKVKQEYQKQRCANFKTCNQYTRMFLNAPWDSFCAMYVLSNVKVRALLIHKYCD